MNFSPKTAWKATKTMKDGHFSHHKKKNPMRFKLPDGSFTKTDKERADMLHSHFHKVFNRNMAVDWNCIKSITRFETIFQISLCLALHNLNWHKEPGKNGVSPNALKI